MSDPSFAEMYTTNNNTGHIDEQIDTNMIEETLHEPRKFHSPNVVKKIIQRKIYLHEKK